MCEVCQRKKSKKKRGLVSKPILHTDMNSRCQIDLIDMQSQEDRGHKFTMVYQDHLTKFVVLRPLTSKRATEVAYQLMDMFLTFGAPCILHSDNGREFVNSVIKELTSYWPEPKLVTGKPRHSQSQGSVERANQDVEKMLASWMQDSKTTNWSNGLKFVQFMKNRAFHSGIKQSPYQAMFGTEPKVGLTTSNLSLEIINRLHNEEDLQVAITEMNQNFSDNEGNQDEQETIKSGKEQEENKEQEEIFEHNRNESMILEAREKAHFNLVKQAKRMKTASDQSHPPLKVGDNVTIPIPDVDKGKADLRNIIGVILEVTCEQLYRIGTKSGILDKLYCRYVPTNSNLIYVYLASL